MTKKTCVIPFTLYICVLFQTEQYVLKIIFLEKSLSLSFSLELNIADQSL